MSLVVVRAGWTALEGVVPLGNITGVASLSLATDGGRRAFTGTLTGNVTLSVSNVPTGLVTVVALLTQDATGGRAVTMPPNTTLLGGSTGSINTAANSSSSTAVRNDNRYSIQFANTGGIYNSANGRHDLQLTVSVTG